MQKTTVSILTFFFLLLTMVLHAGEPVKIILDTDIGNDVDDMLALALAHVLEDRGEIEILAVTMTNDSPSSLRLVSAVNTFYNRPNIPLGIVKAGSSRCDGRFAQEFVEMKDEYGRLFFPNQFGDSAETFEAVSVLRRTLAAQPDNSVVIVQIGFFMNLAGLLDSAPDTYSPLNGKELISQKVKYVSIMAGIFDGTGKKYPQQGAGFNVARNIPAARNVVENWPTEIVFNGSEIGRELLYPIRHFYEDYEYVPHHPVKEWYTHFRRHQDRQLTFDLHSVLYAARQDQGYYKTSNPGKVTFDEKGICDFKPSPDGKHCYLNVDAEQIELIQKAFIQLLCSPPKKTFSRRL